jgi:hypothetical protein
MTSTFRMAIRVPAACREGFLESMPRLSIVSSVLRFQRLCLIAGYRAPLCLEPVRDIRRRSPGTGLHWSGRTDTRSPLSGLAPIAFRSRPGLQIVEGYRADLAIHFVEQPYLAGIS